MRNIQQICQTYLELLKKEGKITLTDKEIEESSFREEDQQIIRENIKKELIDYEVHRGQKISSRRAFMIFCEVVVHSDIKTGHKVYNSLVKQFFNVIERHTLSRLQARRGAGKSYLTILYVTFKMFIIEFFEVLTSFHIPEMRDNWFNTFQELIENNELLLTKKDPNKRSPMWGSKKCRYNKGIVKGITLGSTAKSSHPNLAIVDDILGTGETNKYPNSYIENHIFSDIYPITKRKKARLVIVGTTLNDDDIFHSTAKDKNGKYNRKLLLCNQDKTFVSASGWACRDFPAVLNFDTHEILLPEIFSWEEVMQDKASMGDFKWFREMQGEVKIDKSALISYYLFTKAYDEKRSLQEVGKAGCKYLMIVDPSAGEGEFSDYAAIIVLELNKGQKILRYAWHERLLPIIDPNGGKIDLTHKVVDVFNSFIKPDLYVENNSIGRVLIQSLRKEGVDPYEHETNSDKVKIMTDAISEFKRDNIIVIPHNPECSFTLEAVEELKRECLGYGLSQKKEGKLLIGGKGVNDDLCTAFLLGLHYSNEEGGGYAGCIVQD